MGLNMMKDIYYKFIKPLQGLILLWSIYPAFHTGLFEPDQTVRLVESFQDSFLRLKLVNFLAIFFFESSSVNNSPILKKETTGLQLNKLRLY